jgi:segregation and condensation protein B
MKNNLENKIEAILFYTAEPVSISFLVKTLEIKKEEILEALENLSKSLDERGIRLLHNENEVSLVTAPEHSTLIEKLIKEERERDLGRAGIETLSIIAYKGPVTKKEIEYIRGVNSQYALRNLLLRGLVERKASQSDERMIVYNITTDTLRFLGLKNINELPEYDDVRKQLEVEETETEENPENGE